jgi:hypothetical protein
VSPPYTAIQRILDHLEDAATQTNWTERPEYCELFDAYRAVNRWLEEECAWKKVGDVAAIVAAKLKGRRK